MQQQQRHPPPYSTESGPSTSTPYPTKQLRGPPMKSGLPMQLRSPNNPRYVPTNPRYPSNKAPLVKTTTTRTIVQQQPPAVIVNSEYVFGEIPVSMQCPTCKTQIATRVEFTSGSLAWLTCCGLAAVGCILGCCFIPFCIEETKDVSHRCPNCKTIVGIYRRL